MHKAVSGLTIPDLSNGVDAGDEAEAAAAAQPHIDKATGAFVVDEEEWEIEVEMEEVAAGAAAMGEPEGAADEFEDEDDMLTLGELAGLAKARQAEAPSATAPAAEGGLLDGVI
jgi:hypothetical protein